MMIKKSGAIMVLALLMISAIMLVTEQLMRSVRIGSRFVKMSIAREQAKVLALSGVQLVCAQLVAEEESAQQKDEDKKDQEQKTSKSSKSNQLKKFLKMMFARLNRWQVFDFTEKKDGIDGTVKVCLISEQGKININEAFDFNKQEFKKDYQTLLSGLAITNALNPGVLAKSIQEYLIQRKKKLNDVSELSEIRALESIDVFYSPPKIPLDKKHSAQANTTLAIQDIFTTWTNKAEVHPLLLSDGVLAMFGLTRPKADDGTTKDEIYEKFIEDYDPNWVQDLDKNWEKFEVLFGEKPQNIKNIQALIAKQFEPSVYSVLSYATIGEVEQRILAIIKKVRIKQKVSQDKDAAKKVSSKTKVSYKIMRIYWL